MASFIARAGGVLATNVEMISSIATESHAQSKRGPLED